MTAVSVLPVADWSRRGSDSFVVLIGRTLTVTDVH